MSNAKKCCPTPFEKAEENFNFYLQFVVPMIPKMVKERDRKLASKWLNKLMEETADPKLRTDYLLLLMYAVQRRKLYGPFLRPPSKTGPLQPFVNNMTICQILEVMTNAGSAPPEIQPYYSAVSGDFKDYLVTQEIPECGIHSYLAISNEPLQKWKNPHLAHIAQETTDEACKIGSRCRSITWAVHRENSECSRPTEEVLEPGWEDMGREHSVNLQAIQGSIMSQESMRVHPPSLANLSADIGPQEVPTEAVNRPVTSFSEDMEARFQRAEESLTNSQMERLVAEFEERFAPEMSDDFYMPKQTAAPGPSGAPSKIPRPIQPPHVVDAKSLTRTFSIPQRRYSSTRNIVLQKKT